jgi:hypothetical protein
MSYANWFGTTQSITDNTTLTTVTQNGSNYITTINVVPSVISRSSVLSTMVDEVNTIFFTASNVPPGLYKAGMYFQCGTGAADPWEARDYLNFFVASQDFINNPSNSNAASLYKTRNSTVTPFTMGFDPIGAANGSVNGQHTGFLTISSIQNVNFVAYMEDFADNPTTHSVFMSDPYLQKIG